jgi:hypothetical protein
MILILSVYLQHDFGAIRRSGGVQSEVGVSSLPPLSERIGPKNKNATDYTDSKSLADDAFELEQPGAEIEEQRQP